MNKKSYSFKKSLIPWLWFKIGAKRYHQDKTPLHHASNWRYLNQQQWDEYIDALIKPLDLACDRPFSIFEVGVGSGAVLNRIAHHFPNAQLSGIDPVKRALEIAKIHLPSADLYHGNGLAMKQIPSLHYDVVIAHCVIIYLNNLTEAKAFCDEMIRVAKIGAKIMITSMVEDSGRGNRSGLKIDSITISLMRTSI